VKFTIHDVPQRSEQWFALRAGRVTGSRADAVIAKGRGSEEATKRRDLRILLAQERVAGISLETDGYVSAEMQRGVDLEPAARAAYDAHEGLFNGVRETGFLSADDLMIGASLDGDLNDFETVVSFKCPKSANHYEYARLSEGELPKAYIGQISHELLITGAQFYHFVSFDDRFRGRAESLQLVIKRYKRDQVDLKAYEKELLRFLAEVEQATETMLTLANPSAQMEAVLNGVG
jgi:hypothetical protein